MSLPPPPIPPAGGYVGPYATSSVPLGPMRSLRGLWIGLVVLFALIGVADIVAAGAFWNRAGLIDDVVNGNFPDGGALLDADDAVQGAIVAHSLLLITLAIVFIIWQFQHAKNAQAMGERGGLGPGWAIGGWFIPVANLVLPGVQIHQSSRLSDLAVVRQPGTKGKGSGIVIVWMVLLALASLVFVIGGGVARDRQRGEPPDQDHGRHQGRRQQRPRGRHGDGPVRRRGRGGRMHGAEPLDEADGGLPGPPQRRAAAAPRGRDAVLRSGAACRRHPPRRLRPSRPGQWGGPPPAWSQPPAAPPPSEPEPPTQWGTPPP